MSAFLLWSLLAVQDPEALIRKLGAEAPEARHEAQAALSRLGEAAEKALRAAAGDPDPEIRVRVGALLEGISARRLGALLVRGGVPQAWVDKNQALVRALELGSVRELAEAIREVRGIDDGCGFVQSSAHLLGSNGAVALNRIVHRLGKLQPLPAELQRIVPQICWAVEYVGTGNNSATGDRLDGFDVMALISLLPPEPDATLLAYVRPVLQRLTGTNLNLRVINGGARWPEALAPDVLKALLICPSPQLEAGLIEWSRSPEAGRRSMAAELMRGWKVDGAGALSTLIEDPDDRVRASSVRALADRGDRRPRAMLSDPSPRVRAAVLDSAGVHRWKGFEPAVLEGLRSGDSVEVAAACRAAGAMAIEEAAPLLMEAGLRHRDDPMVVQEAIRALPLTGWDFPPDQVLEWGGGDRACADALILGGRLPDPAKAAAHLSDWGMHGFIVWMAAEGGAGVRDTFDLAIPKSKRIDMLWHGYGLLKLYKEIDPDRLRRVATVLRASESPDAIAWGLRISLDEEFSVPDDELEGFLSSEHEGVASVARAFKAGQRAGMSFGCGTRDLTEEEAGIQRRFLLLQGGDPAELRLVLERLPELYRGDRLYWPEARYLVAANAVAAPDAFLRLNKIQLTDKDRTPLKTIAAGLKLKLSVSDEAAARRPCVNPTMSAFDHLEHLSRDLRLRVAPLIDGDTLRIVSWTEAIRFWRAEHVRRSRVRNE